MMANPKYNIGDTVYLTVSAQKGFIESYTILQLTAGPDGFWQYVVGIPQSAPIINTTVGDMNSLKGNFSAVNIRFYEDELSTYCEALDIAIPLVLAQYNRLVSLREQFCEVSEDGTGTG
jgi:hypothetical protein